MCHDLRKVFTLAVSLTLFLPPMGWISPYKQIIFEIKNLPKFLPRFQQLLHGLVVMWLAIGSEFPGSNPGNSRNHFFPIYWFIAIYLCDFFLSLFFLSVLLFPMITLWCHKMKWKMKVKKKTKKSIVALMRLEPMIYGLQGRRANHYTTRNNTIRVW